MIKNMIPKEKGGSNDSALVRKMGMIDKSLSKILDKMSKMNTRIVPYAA